MIEIFPTYGPPVQVMEESITLIAGPYPSDVGHFSYIHGFSIGVIATAEPVQHFLARLAVKPPLVQFTRPNNTPVWIKASAVTEVTPPLPPGAYAEGTKSILWLARLRQAVVEDMDAVRQKLEKGHGPVGTGSPLSAVFYDADAALTEASVAAPASTPAPRTGRSGRHKG